MAQLLLAGVHGLLFAAAPPSSDEDRVDYRSQVVPILKKHCYECHGEDEDSREADLRMDRDQDLFVDLGGDIVMVKPGDVENSYMMERILAEDDFDRMPPPDYGPRLSDEESSILVRWIEQGASTRAPVDFHTQIRPILDKHCFECHGEDEDMREADLRLDTRDDLFQDLGGDLLMVRAGDVEASYMMERILAEDDFDRMPPPDYGPRLSDEEIALLTQWIEEGAKWSEAPIEAPTEPAVEPLPEAELALVGPVDFAQHLLPILADRCWTCHGPQLDPPTADLGLASHADFHDARGDAGPALVAGKPEQSLIYQRVSTGDIDERMPPDGCPPMTARERALLRRWIEEGATWKQHWSFAPLQRPEGPKGAAAVDHFVDAQLAAAELEAAPPVSAARLLRRWCFDLAGRPPRLDELEAIEADASPEALARFLDQLLASPESAARLAARWTARCEQDGALTGDAADAWRAWVQQAFADNLGFDAFTRAQLAGDLDAALDDAAAGLLRAGTAVDASTLPERHAEHEAARRARVVARMWLGMDVLTSMDQVDPQRAEFFGPAALESLIEVLSAGPEAEPCTHFLAFLPPQAEPAPGGRANFAGWLTDEASRLSARVAVDHAWRLLFGRGLLPEGEDFGPGSPEPALRELLDCLAADLIAGGWDFRALLRSIALSRAYARSAQPPAGADSKDPDGSLMSHRSRRGLEPSMVLAQAKAVAGRDDLDARQPVSGTEWTDLALRNHPFFVDTARCFGTRLLSEETGTVRRLVRGFRECTSRDPSDEELLVLARLYQEQFNRYVSDEARSRELLGEAADTDSEYSVGERAAWTAIAGVLLCVDETLHR